MDHPYKGPSIDYLVAKFAELGFSAVQFHDDDAVPNINDYTEEEIKVKARELKATLDELGSARISEPCDYPHIRVLNVCRQA